MMKPYSTSALSSIIMRDFIDCDEEELCAILAMRNDPRVAMFMYAPSISMKTHREFCNSLRKDSSARYWLFIHDGWHLGVGSLSRISLAHHHAYIGIYTNPFLTPADKKALYARLPYTSIGDMIFHKLEYMACEYGLHALFLEALASNMRARAFYERHGYVLQGVMRDYVKQGEHFHHVCCYGKVLDAKDVASMPSASKDIDASAQDASSCLLFVAPPLAPSLPISPLSSQSLPISSPPIIPPSSSYPATSFHLSSAPSLKPPAISPSSALSSAPLRRPLLVAEISANHNKKLNLALRTIRAAKIAGADYVKLQTYTPECLTIDSNLSHFHIHSGTTWDGQTLYKLYQQAYTPFAWHKELFAYARALDIGIFSTPFSPRALELLEDLACPMYKIASFEITDTPFIKLVASTKKPIIISTGIATHRDIEQALQACKDAGNHNITLLLCTSAYPASLDTACIAAMPQLARYGVRYGLSDHTQGDICALLACALGASMIEKHFIIKRALGGVDAHFSMEAREFQALSRAIDDAMLALGNGDLDSKLSINIGREFARSLCVCEDIAQGEELSMHNIRSIRPNVGLPPYLLPQILGKRALRNLQKGMPLSWGDFA